MLTLYQTSPSQYDTESPPQDWWNSLLPLFIDRSVMFAVIFTRSPCRKNEMLVLLRANAGRTAATLARH